jgi:hypothetical protein
MKPVFLWVSLIILVIVVAAVAVAYVPSMFWASRNEESTNVDEEPI